MNLLHQSLKIRSNSRARIDVLPVTISDSIDIVELITSRQGRAGNLIKELSSCTQKERVFENELVITVTLDWLLDRYPAPNVVKSDVEGAEERVLKGARKMLSTIRPRILCEVLPQNNAGVTNILKESGYTLYNADIGPEKREVLNSAAFNTIAYPS